VIVLPVRTYVAVPVADDTRVGGGGSFAAFIVDMYVVLLTVTLSSLPHAASAITDAAAPSRILLLMNLSPDETVGG
jgi:hypothetical protein